MEKYWLFCNKERLVSYKYKNNVTFDDVLRDILAYYNFTDIEKIKETKDEYVFNAVFNGIKSKYKIVKFKI